MGFDSSSVSSRSTGPRRPEHGAYDRRAGAASTWVAALHGGGARHRGEAAWHGDRR